MIAIWWGSGQLKSEVQLAANAEPHKKHEILHSLLNYEDAGPGGFYDDLGNPQKSPHLTKGWSYDGGDFPTSLRPSQRTTAFTTHETDGVTLEYRGLNKQAAYRVRLALIRPSFLPRFAHRQLQKSQSILADGQLLAEDVELPEGEVRMFECSIPQELTADGRLTLSLRKAPGVGEGLESIVNVWRNTGGWGTVASDVWLLKESDL